MYINMTSSYPRRCDCCDYTAKYQQLWYNHIKSKKHQQNANKCSPCNNTAKNTNTNNIYINMKTDDNNNINNNNNNNNNNNVQNLLLIIKNLNNTVRTLNDTIEKQSEIISNLMDNSTQIINTHTCYNNIDSNCVGTEANNCYKVHETQSDIDTTLSVCDTTQSTEANQVTFKDDDQAFNLEDVFNEDKYDASELTNRAFVDTIQKINKIKRPIKIQNNNLYYKTNNKWQTGNRKHVESNIEQFLHKFKTEMITHKKNKTDKPRSLIDDDNYNEREMNDYLLMVKSFVSSPSFDLFDAKMGLTDKLLTI